MQSFQIPSHGGLLNAFVYVASGPGPHPAVVLLHGFPGNERNLDLAQDIRSVGWDVLYFDYRGSWGSPGDFSFSHGIEDTAAAINYVRSPEMAGILRLDPSRIVLLGHSMGGFMAVQAAAADVGIMGVALISAADFGGRIPQPLSKDGEEAEIRALSASYDRDGMEPLAGCTGEGLARELLANAVQWSFAGKVEALKMRPLLIVSSEDAYAPGKRGICKRIAARGKQPCVYPAPAHRSRVFRSARPPLGGRSSLACDACPAGNNLLIFPGLPGVRVMVVVMMMVMVWLRERRPRDEQNHGEQQNLFHGPDDSNIRSN